MIDEKELIEEIKKQFPLMDANHIVKSTLEEVGDIINHRPKAKISELVEDIPKVSPRLVQEPPAYTVGRNYLRMFIVIEKQHMEIECLREFSKSLQNAIHKLLQRINRQNADAPDTNVGSITRTPEEVAEMMYEVAMCNKCIQRMKCRESNKACRELWMEWLTGKEVKG